MKIGVLHPGEMGSAVAAVLARDHDVRYASDGRSADTIARAAADELSDSVTPQALADHADVLLSICPPHAARDVAEQVADFQGIYVDANAVSPDTAKAVAAVVRNADFVDGGIIGGPPRRAGTTRLVLSGGSAARVAALFDGTGLEPVLVDDRVGSASAVKMLYAAWTKGTAAMLLAIRAAARESGVEDALLAEWARSQPGLQDRSEGAARSAAGKGWRWIGEMDEIAATFAASGLPAGFHEASSAIFGRSPRGDADLDAVLAAIRA